MQKKRCVVANTFLFRTTPLVLALSAMAAMCSTTYAAQLGHARIVSQQGQPLRVAVPVTQLSQQDKQAFAVSAAPISDWKQAGLIPPVDPATLQFQLLDGARPTVKTIQVSSTQPFSGPVADLLLNVQTASGRQQYQVSILAPVQAGAAPSSGAASQGAPGTAAGSASAGHGMPAQAIRVRHGDTMFSIARRHAVPQVSVYQMMIALQRANPQAFIKGNVNLVKAGAMLQMPDLTQLTAVSDSEARRIFQRHAQEFEQYRQGLAGHKGQAVTGGSAAKGRLSTEAPAAGSAQNTAQAQDKVVLSSGSAADKAADERTATGKNLADSQERVSQLEQNVKNLNQALQGQGQAAKDAVIEGASGLGQTISDAANSLSNSSDTAAGTAAGSGVGSTAASAAETKSAAAAPASSAALATSATVSAAAASQPAQAGGPVASKAGTGAAAALQADGKSAAGAADSSKNTVNNASSKAGQSVSWFQEHLLGVVTALLALAVLIIAWVLRRANAARDDDDPASPVTEAMVQEQLDKINLDLREPPSTHTK